MRRDGFILVPVLLVTACLFALAAALLSLALSDSRMAGYVADHARLYYFAEAGAEFALACLPREYGEFAKFCAELESPEDEPCFRVSVYEADEEGVKRIVSVGLGDGRSREVEVRARLCLLGETALVIGGEARLGRVTVHGGVAAGKVVLGDGPTVIGGELLYREMVQEGPGSIAMQSEKQVEEVPGLSMDFDFWEEAALAEGWPVFEEDVTWNGATVVPERALVKGNLALLEGFSAGGFWVVRGDVTVACAQSEIYAVLLAEGEIALNMRGPLQRLGGSLVLYGKEGIIDRREPAEATLVVKGVLAGGRLELKDAEVVFDEESLHAVAGMFAPGTFLPFTRVQAKWVDLSFRR